MTMLPSLLSPHSVAGCDSPEKLRADHFGKLFGDLAAVVSLPDLAECLDRFSVLPDDLYAEWRRAVAEELLLARACGRSVPPAWLAEFADVSPFGNAVTLRDCGERPCACAVFPLATDDAPGVGHVWIVHGLGHRDPISDDEPQVIPAGYGICCVTTRYQWHGRSWQLAGRLALRAVEGRSAAAVATLAGQWIVTGRVDPSGYTVGVTLGNKLELPTKRRWLVPLENIPAVPPTAATLTIRSAADEDSAWSHVTGEGIQPGADLPWPTTVGALHILIGGNLKAAVVSALFSPAGTPVQFWHSDSEKGSRLPAAAARIVLAELRPDLLLAAPRRLDSRDLVTAERTLRDALGGQARSQPVLINITSGNRLMGLAADAVARLYPNVTQVYRDIDAAPFLFTRIDYQRYPHESGTYRGAEAALAGLNSGFFFGRDAYTGDSAAALAADFLATCRATDSRVDGTGGVHKSP